MATNKATNKVQKVFKMKGIKSGAQRRATNVGKRHAKDSRFIKDGTILAHYRDGDLKAAYMAGLTA